MEVRSSGVRGPQEAPDCRGSKKVWSTENREDEGVVSRGQGEEGGTRVGEHRKDWRGKEGSALKGPSEGTRGGREAPNDATQGGGPEENRC